MQKQKQEKEGMGKDLTKTKARNIHITVIGKSICIADLNRFLKNG